MCKPISQAFLLILLFANNSWAANYDFGNNANGLSGLASSTLAQEGTNLNLAVVTAGATLNEDNSDGLGIDSNNIPGTVDSSGSKLNVLGGTLAGIRESLTFSFDKPGILDLLRFDGLKDEPLEYFSLETPSGTVLSLFDFEVELRLNDQGFQLSDLGVANPVQADGPSDDFSGLAIPFAAGEIFTLSYGEIDYDGSVLPGYYPADNALNPTNDLPNGARFEGLGYSVVPEPNSLALLVLGALAACKRKRPHCC